MKTIGLIGGMSWESTAVYYRHINQQVRRLRGGLASADIALRSLDFTGVVALQKAGRWDLAGVRFYLEQLFPAGQSWLLLLAVLAGLTLGNCGRRQQLGLLLAAAVPLLLIASLALPLRPRYGLAALPLLYLLGAHQVHG